MGARSILLATMAIHVLGCSSDADPPAPEAPPDEPAAVASVVISPEVPEVIVGRSVQLTAEVRDSEGNALTREIGWTSLSTGVAIISNAGVATGVSLGTTVIRATSEGETGEAVLTVKPVPVSTVEISGVQTLVPKQFLLLAAVPLDANGTPLTGRTIEWSSSTRDIATVNSSGVVSALAPGNAVIHATSEGKSAAASITVREGGWVTPAGATVSAWDGAVEIVIPAKGVSGGRAITVDPMDDAPAHPRMVPNTAYDLGPDELQFNLPVSLTIEFGALPNGMNAERLRVHRWDGAAWLEVGGVVDVDSQTVTAQTSGLGIYALVEVPAPAAAATRRR